MTTSLLYIIVSAVIILSVASLATFLGLKKNSKNQTLQKVSTIVKTWWYIIGFILLCLALAPNGLLFGFCVLSLVAVREYYRNSKLEGLKFSLTILLSLYVIFQYALLYFGKVHLFHTFPLLYLLLVLPGVLIFKNGVKKLPEAMSTVVAPVLMFHFLACLPALYLNVLSVEGSKSQAELYIFCLILLTGGNDVFQFICGKAFGKNKPIPEISPNKTEAGFIGGFLVTALLGMILFSKLLDLGILRSFVYGAVISIYGMLGDLLFSTLKRYFETKDFSASLPGHGGYLDRLDSLILTSPILYYTVLFFGGEFL